LLPRGSFVEIPNGSHAVHYAAPAVVAEVVRSFIRCAMVENDSAGRTPVVAK
jgi:pimeloyl-ACP methyl ester carboxylesterase